ncbi:MAG: DNA polymerase III subunit alpha, partial [Gammaproteobacteria bacterium]
MTPSFVHLRVHTEYSLVDSVVRIGALMDQAVAQGTPALGLTDESNLFALVKFYRAALSRGIKPIVGVDILVAPESEDREPGVMTLLCQDRQGYLNLSSLITDSYARGQQSGRPMVSPSWLTPERSCGLIAMVGPRRSHFAQALESGSPQRAEGILGRWAKVFPGRLYLEVQRIGAPGETNYLQAAVDLGARMSLPLVATNDVRFLRADDFEAHEARVCIHQGRALNDTTRPKHYSGEQHLKSPEQMQTLFADIPEALQNSVEIAKRCNLEIELGESYLPAFPTPGKASAAEHLRAEAQHGLDNRLQRVNGSGKDTDAYQQRLDRELDVICRMGFEGYFLIVADFISWAREQRIPVGPGRGSGAGSLVAYALGITDLDPLEFDLLFERFLNPERVSMPDFDIDFCIDGRDRVIEYVTQRYGKDRVSQIITYGSMAARAVVRDVGRVLGHPFGFVDRIAKLIPFEVGMTLDKALAQDEELRRAHENEDDVRALIDLARPLEGLARNAGKHAGGVVISPKPLTDFTPLYCEAEAAGFVTQLDKDDVEAIGLVKFDFLGLKTLTVIDKALQRVNADRLRESLTTLEVADIPMGDAKTYELLSNC